MNRFFQIAMDVFWMAVVICGGGWLIIRSLKASEEPKKIIFKWLFTIPMIGGEIFLARHLMGSIQPGDIGSNFAPTFALVISIAACCVMVSVIWGTHIGNVVTQPILNLFDGGNEPADPKPFYSIAISKRKLNKPLEAIVEVRKQLAKFPNDYEGVILLATIQAEDTKDLPGAEITLNNFCNSENAPDKQVAAAFTQMADWHLKLAQDSGSAQMALEKIAGRFPDSELALVAKQRIAHLGGTEKILLAAHDRQAMAVPEGIKNVGLLDSSKHLIPEETNPAELAAICVKHLAQHPQDTEIREKLALVYSEHYGRLDLATNELQQLIEEPNQLPKRAAHWLNLLADLQIRHGADYEAIRATLERIVEKFPELPVANIAQSRLNLLKLELKGRQETPDKKLGVYEQNIGLKGDRIYSPRQL